MKILRWVGILPAMVLVWAGFFLVAAFTIGLTSVFGQDRSGRSARDDFSIMPLILMGLCGYAMVMVAQKLAPSAKRLTAIGASALVVLVFGGAAIAWGEGFVDRIADMAISAGAVFAGLQAYRFESLSLD